MSSPPLAQSGWSEQNILALPVGENDSFERKGTRSLDLTITGVKEGDVLDELGKQLSAFANTGGGTLLYGLNNAGAVDQGGVSRIVKGRQSTREWLEDIIPVLTDPEVVGCNVHEIMPTDASSLIAADKSLFVVEVPNSDRAPHQSKRDFKYYVRLGGKSRPASHRLIEDIRNRQLHPELGIKSITLAIVSMPAFNDGDPPTLASPVPIRLTALVRNRGRIMARNACLHLVPSISLGWGGWARDTIRRRGEIPFHWEFVDPVYPAMELAVWIDLQVSAEVNRRQGFGPVWALNGMPLDEAKIKFECFADNAPAIEETRTFEQMGFAAVARETLSYNPLGKKIFEAYRYL
jgi:hypothetical protein